MNLQEFKDRLQILHRLTISYSDQSNIHKLVRPFLLI